MQKQNVVQRVKSYEFKQNVNKASYVGALFFYNLLKMASKKIQKNGELIRI